MEKKPVHRAIRLEEAIADLMDAEKIVAQLENTHALQAFTCEQRAHYYAALLLLRELLKDLSEDNSLEQLASQLWLPIKFARGTFSGRQRT